MDNHAKVLMKTKWGERKAFAMFAPQNKNPMGRRFHCRLGSKSTAIAQIMYFHRQCPFGFVNYTAPGFAPTGMDFDSQIFLCEWE